MGKSQRPGSNFKIDMRYGTFVYGLNENLRINCQMNFEKYPMDQQVCHLRITSLMYGVDKVVIFIAFCPVPGVTNMYKLYISWQNFTQHGLNMDEDVISNMISNSMYQVTFEELEIKTIPWGSTDLRSVAGFQFRLVRRRAEILMMTYLPCTMLLLISFIGFFIPVHIIPGRMALLVTIFLMLVNISSSEKTDGSNVRALQLTYD